jgi:hypothetical protein
MFNRQQAEVSEAARISGCLSLIEQKGGVMNWTSPIQNVGIACLCQCTNVNPEANFCKRFLPVYKLDEPPRKVSSYFLEVAYHTTIPYLIEPGNSYDIWTLITGGAGELGLAGITAVSQGALFSLGNAACLENPKGITSRWILFDDILNDFLSNLSSSKAIQITWKGLGNSPRSRPCLLNEMRFSNPLGSNAPELFN